MSIGLPSLDQAQIRFLDESSKPVVSGVVLASDGFRAGTVHEPAFEVTAPATSSHLVVVTLSPRDRCEGEVDGRAWPVRFRIGTSAVLPAGSRSRWLHHDPATVVHLLLDGLRFHRLLEDAGECASALEPALLRRDPAFLRIARAVMKEAAMPGTASRLYADHMCLAVAVRLARLRADGGTAQPGELLALPLSSPRLRRAIACIHDRLADDLSHAELASEAGMSPFHFARAFKAATGLPPHRYVLQCRVQRAQALLVETHQSVTEIAHACGFSSSQHLAKVFRQHVGATPSGYRGGRR